MCGRDSLWMELLFYCVRIFPCRLTIFTTCHLEKKKEPNWTSRQIKASTKKVLYFWVWFCLVMRVAQHLLAFSFEFSFTFFSYFTNGRNSTIANAQHMTFYMFACAIGYKIPFSNQIEATRKCLKVHCCVLFCCHILNIFQINTTFSTGAFATCARLFVCAWGYLRKWIDNKLLTIHSPRKTKLLQLKKWVAFFASTHCMSIGITLQHLSFVWFVPKIKSRVLPIPKNLKQQLLRVCLFCVWFRQCENFSYNFLPV